MICRLKAPKIDLVKLSNLISALALEKPKVQSLRGCQELFCLLHLLVVNLVCIWDKDALHASFPRGLDAE